MCETVLGSSYRIIEVASETAFQGPEGQLWHPRLPVPEDSWNDRRITSPAFRLTGVDVTPDAGPVEFKPGTQLGRRARLGSRMISDQDPLLRFAERTVRKRSRMGETSSVDPP